MDSRMAKELCMNALLDAINHTDDTEGCILHSNRGSQYCSLDYQALAKQHGFISSMSRKDNCWGQCADGELLGQEQAGMAE